MDRKEDETSADTPENEPEKANAAPGPVTAFQDKMEKWTDRVGYGAYRGLICGLFSALGLDIVLVIVRSSQAVLTHSFGKRDTDTFGEMLVYSVGFNTPTLGSALKKIRCVLYYRHERTCLQTS